MKQRLMCSTISLLILVSSSICHGQNEASWIKTSDESLKTQWESVDAKTRKKVGAYLLKKLHLSSTGKIELIGVYKLTHDDTLGVQGDTVIHFLQKEQGGSRLFWSCLVNLDKGTIQVLYRASKPSVGNLAAFEKIGSLDDAAEIVGRAELTELRDTDGKLVPRVGRDKDDRVIRLILNDMKLSPDDVADLGSLDRLRSLVLLRTGFTDGDLAKLIGCQNLEHLNLTSTEVTDDAVDTILKLDSLKSVCLGDVKITPIALEKLKERNRNRTPDKHLRWGYSQRNQ